MVQELYENIPTKGPQIISGLENHLVEVDKALSNLYEVLTKNNIEEVVKVGRDKYKAIAKLTHTKVSPVNVFDSGCFFFLIEF